MPPTGMSVGKSAVALDWEHEPCVKDDAMLPCTNVLNTVNVEKAKASVHVGFQMFAFM